MDDQGGSSQHIKDYVNFLDRVYDEVMTQVGNRNIQVNVLGFSQGTATVCRWLCQGKAKADNLIFWAGAFPRDLDLEVDKRVFRSMNNWIVVGDRDQFIEWSQVEEFEKLLRQQNIPHRMIKFSGKHEVRDEPLLQLLGEMR